MCAHWGGSGKRATDRPRGGRAAKEIGNDSAAGRRKGEPSGCGAVRTGRPSSSAGSSGVRGPWGALTCLWGPPPARPGAWLPSRSQTGRKAGNSLEEGTVWGDVSGQAQEFRTVPRPPAGLRWGWVAAPCQPSLRPALATPSGLCDPFRDQTFVWGVGWGRARGGVPVPCPSSETQGAPVCVWKAPEACEIKLLKVVRQKGRLGQCGEGVGHRRELCPRSGSGGRGLGATLCR